MELALAFLMAFAAAGCGRKAAPPGATARYEKAMQELAAARTDEARFYALDAAQREAFTAGKYADAKGYAEEQARLLPKFRANWNYGNAVQDINITLGRLAARDGRYEEAGDYLLKSADSDGSPQMNSFGPNMLLARDLLQADRRAVVLEYFGLCSRFWKKDNGKLEEWSKTVRDHGMPDFGANLDY